MEPLYDCPQDPEWHPEGNVWIHTLMVIDEARERNGDLDRAAPGHRDARRGLPRPRQAGDHRDDRRPRAIAEPRGRGRRAGDAMLDRLNVSTLDDFDVRAQVLGLVAEHLRPSAFYKARDTVTDGAFRRLAQKVDLELLVRFARADCHGRTGHVRLLGAWIGSSSGRGRWGWSTSRPRRSCWAGT